MRVSFVEARVRFFWLVERASTEDYVFVQRTPTNENKLDLLLLVSL